MCTYICVCALCVHVVCFLDPLLAIVGGSAVSINMHMHIYVHTLYDIMCTYILYIIMCMQP